MERENIFANTFLCSDSNDPVVGAKPPSSSNSVSEWPITGGDYTHTLLETVFLKVGDAPTPGGFEDNYFENTVTLMLTLFSMC